MKGVLIDPNLKQHLANMQFPNQSVNTLQQDSTLDSLRTAHINISSLLNSLESTADTFQNVPLDFIEKNTSGLLDSFKANLSEMQNDFMAILQKFKSGGLSPSEIESLLDAEQKKSFFTLELASDMIKFLENVFTTINVVLKKFDSDATSIPEFHYIVGDLDQTMESLIGISRIVSAGPRNITHAMNVIEVQKKELSKNPERGHFNRILQQLSRGNLIKGLSTKEFTFQDAMAAFGRNDDSPTDSSPGISELNSSFHEFAAAPPPLLRNASVRVHSFSVESTYPRKKSNFKDLVRQVGKQAVEAARKGGESTLTTTASPNSGSTNRAIPSTENLRDSKQSFKTTENEEYIKKMNTGTVTEEQLDRNTASPLQQQHQLQPKQYHQQQQQQQQQQQLPQQQLHQQQQQDIICKVTVTKNVLLVTSKVINFSQTFDTTITKASLSTKSKYSSSTTTSSTKSRAESIIAKSTVAPLTSSSKVVKTDSIEATAAAAASSTDGNNEETAAVTSSSTKKPTRKNVLIEKLKKKVKSGMIAIELSDELTAANPEIAAKVKERLNDFSERFANLTEKETHLARMESLCKRKALELDLEVASRVQQIVKDNENGDQLNELILRMRSKVNLDKSDLSTNTMEPDRISVSTNTDNIASVVPVETSITSPSLNNENVLKGETSKNLSSLSHLSTQASDLCKIISLVVSFLPTSTSGMSPAPLLSSLRHSLSPSTPPIALIQAENRKKLDDGVGGGDSSSRSSPLITSNKVLPPIESKSLPDLYKSNIIHQDSYLSASSTAIATPPGQLAPISYIQRKDSLCKSADSSYQTLTQRHPRKNSEYGKFPLDFDTRSISNNDLTTFKEKRRNSVIKGFVETIVIYPVNTANKYTNTDNNITAVDTLLDVSTSTTLSMVIPPSFHLKLSSSENPLLLLYETYKNDLSELAKSRFLSAVSGESNSTNSLPILSKVFTNVTQEMEKLRTAVTSVDCTITSCEESLRILTSGGGGGGDNTIKYEERRQEQGLRLFNDIGSVSSSLLLLQLQFSEYRTMFERLIASEASRLPRLLQSCAAFNESYQIFVDCQGKLRTQQGRLLDLKGKCQRIYRQLPQFANNADGMNSSNNSNNNTSSSSSSNGIEKLEKEIVILRSEMERNGSYIHQLEEELREAEMEIDNLEREVFQASQLGDRTPAALLFFSMLQEDSALPSIQQVVLQLGHFKSFIDGSEHIDFPTLRKRLTVCVDCVPNIQLFLSRYNQMYQKWMVEKHKLLAQRRLSISSNSNNNNTVDVCPLCFGGDTHHHPSNTTIISMTASNIFPNNSSSSSSSSITHRQGSEFPKSRGGGGGGGGSNKRSSVTNTLSFGTATANAASSISSATSNDFTLMSSSIDVKPSYATPLRKSSLFLKK